MALVFHTLHSDPGETAVQNASCDQEDRVAHLDKLDVTPAARQRAVALCQLSQHGPRHRQAHIHFHGPTFISQCQAAQACTSPQGMPQNPPAGRLQDRQLLHKGVNTKGSVHTLFCHTGSSCQACQAQGQLRGSSRLWGGRGPGRPLGRPGREHGGAGLGGILGG